VLQVDGYSGFASLQLPRLSGSSPLAEALRHALRHWSGLILFLDDGRIELDTNVVERGMRPVALTRNNVLFAGSDGGAEHWAIVMTLLTTAKLNGIEPLAWLTDVLQRVVSGRTGRTRSSSCSRGTGDHRGRHNSLKPRSGRADGPCNAASTGRSARPRSPTAATAARSVAPASLARAAGPPGARVWMGSCA
jgi:hypothetical protein